MAVAVVPTVAVDGELHDEITGGLLAKIMIELAVIVPQNLEADAPLESVAVTVTK